ncbi:MAG: hypothetical protein ABL871_05135 [Terricaulis sp.]
MKKRVQAFSVVVGCAVLSACASVSLESRNAENGGVGAAYMAPMRMLNLTATRGPASVEASPAALREAQAALIAASNAAATAATTAATKQTEMRTAEAAFNAVSSNDPADVRTALQTARDKARTDNSSAQATLRGAQNTLSEAQANYRALVRAVETGGQWRETLEITMGEARGDPNATFVADTNESMFRSGHGEIRIVGGLLQSSNMTFAGELPESIDAAVSSIAAIMTAGGGAQPLTPGSGPGRTLEGPAPPPITCSNGEIVMQPVPQEQGPRTLNLTFDPADPRQIRSVNFSLCRAGFSRRVFIVPPSQQARERANADSGVAERAEAAAQRAETAAAGLEGAVTRASNEADRASAAAMRAEAATTNRQRPQRERASNGAAEHTGSIAIDESETLASARDVTGLSLQSTGEAPASPVLSCGTGCPGLVYRQAQPFAVHVVRLSDVCPSPLTACLPQELPFVERSWRFDLPNNAPLHVLPYRASWVVARRDNVGFVDGTLVSHEFDHPSEASRILGIPGRAVNTFFSSVSSVLQLRINLAGQEEQYARARADLAAARRDAGPDEADRLRRVEEMLRLELSITRLRAELAALEAEQADEPSSAP